MGWNPGHLLHSRGVDLVLGRARAWGELLRLIVGDPKGQFPRVLLPGLPLRSAMRVLPPSFLPSSIPFFLFSSFFFFFHFFLPLFFPPSPPERANFYQSNSIKRIKNCFWISEPDQIPDSLLNSCMNLGKWFTPAPPFFFFFFPVRGRTVVQLLTWEVVSIHLKNVCKLLHTVPDTKEVIQKHSFPALFNLGMTSFAP